MDISPGAAYRLPDPSEGGMEWDGGFDGPANMAQPEASQHAPGPDPEPEGPLADALRASGLKVHLVGPLMELLGFDDDDEPEDAAHIPQEELTEVVRKWVINGTPANAGQKGHALRILGSLRAAFGPSSTPQNGANTSRLSANDQYQPLAGQPASSHPVVVQIADPADNPDRLPYSDVMDQARGGHLGVRTMRLRYRGPHNDLRSWVALKSRHSPVCGSGCALSIDRHDNTL